MTVAPRAEVALRVERLAAQRARRPARGEDAQRAGDELAGVGGGEPDPEQVRPVLGVVVLECLGLAFLALLGVLVRLGDLAGLEQDEVVAAVPAEGQDAGLERLVQRLVERLASPVTSASSSAPSIPRRSSSSSRSPSRWARTATWTFSTATDTILPPSRACR